MSSLGGLIGRRSAQRSDDEFEKQSLLPSSSLISELDSDISLGSSRQSRLNAARHSRFRRKNKRTSWMTLNAVIRFFILLVAFGALSALALTFGRGHRSIAESSLGAGLEQCKYISTIPGPPVDFHQRKQSDRFEPATKAVLLRNAKIWTGNGNGTEVIEGDLLMDRGLIESVGKEDYGYLSRLRAAREIDEIDVHGLWVTPGIVDGHSHGQLDCVTCTMSFNA